MAETLDRRLNAYRDDLADASLSGRVEAARFVEAQPYRIATSIAPVHPRPSADADLDTEALGGEAVRVYEIKNHWAWCQLAGDGYVGYIPADYLAAGAPPPPTHKVSSPEAFAYAGPTARSKPARAWLFGAAINVTSEAPDGFLELGDGSFIGHRHVEPIGSTVADHVETAMKMLGAPYLWGGKSIRGIDCSGLVQLALLRAGVACPRDTDMQANMLPGDLDLTDNILSHLQRGDIVYWPGHVGIMINATDMLHANGTNMSTTIDSVEDVASRSRKGGPLVSAVKRLM